MNADALAEEKDHSAVERDSAVRFTSLDCIEVLKFAIPLSCSTP